VTIPSINFEDIRPIDGTKHAGFEEICAQLAAQEPADPRAVFVRKGRGGDGGVECFRQEPAGHEIGWQAKYLFHWDDSLASQLSDSIERALSRHPRLTEYIVCLPFDLPDARTGKGKSARQKWDSWKSHWLGKAEDQGRTLSITLWGKSELISRLARDTAQASGRILYWFDKEVFTSAWFRDQFEKTKEALGSRYTPESNVELPIRQDFLSLARDEHLQKEVDAWSLRVSDDGASAIRAIDGLSTQAAAAESAALRASINQLTRHLGREPVRPDQSFPLDEWLAVTKECLKVAQRSWRLLYCLAETDGKTTSDTDPASYVRHALRKLLEALADVSEGLSSRRWQLANQRAVLVTGEAGTGKSHLLADIVEHEILSGRPAVMVLGSSLRDEEPWRQILTELDRPPAEQVKQFLGALDAAAEAAGARALLCVDALNERNGVRIWPHRLAAFLKVADAFPRIAVVVSCRTTYLPYVIPADLKPERLFRVAHAGFSDNGGKAASIYLNKRGVVRPGAPNLLPEFNNPLFLKTCCDFLQKENRNELPRGLRGLTSIFTFYSEAVTRAINQRMLLDPSYELIPQAIAGFADQLTKSERGYLEKTAAIAFFEKLRPSNGEFEKSLLSQFVAEGVLSAEPIRNDDGGVTEFVRFTFERFSDHAIASHLLSTHLINDDVARSFARGSRLFEVVCGARNYEQAGVIEAISIQLAETTGVELIDVCGKKNWTLRKAFLDSLLWRDQGRFTDRTLDIVRSLIDQDEVNDLLIAVSTEPENKFNARYVHSRLKDVAMPERDAFWSTYLARKGFTGEIETVVAWVLENGVAYVEEERAHLTGLMLTWFFTTSHRVVRDKATKALASLLASRPALGARLLHDFHGINDPYVTERLLASCYGAALQGKSDGLIELAEAVYNLFFEDGSPIVDALAREHASGIVEYANWRGVLPPKVELQKCRPPYKSQWPIEFVPDELVNSYTEIHKRGTFRDDIVGSTDEGDFARYQMDHKVDKWSPASLGTQDLPDIGDIFDRWHSEFSGWASSKQRAAFRTLQSAHEAARGVNQFQDVPEIASLKAARQGFRKLLTSDQWEDFRSRADRFMPLERDGAWWRNKPAPFDIAWARRWVCKRAHDLGWTQERFGDHERGLRSYGRMDHKIERIGKKYQWIALRELIARMSDNLAYIGEAWSREDCSASAYTGARTIGLRDTDPSLLTSGTYYDGWAEGQRTWWVPVQMNLRPMEPRERLAWLESDGDILNGTALIDLKNRKTGSRWLTLSSFAHWQAYGLRGGEKEYQRETWFRLRCLVTRKRNLDALVRGLSRKTLTDPYSLERIDLSQDFYIGEYPWHPDLKDVDQWTTTSDWRAPAVPVRATTAQYRCETGGYDFSIDRTVSVEIPAPWLATAMGLHMSNGQRPVYEDASGNVRFLDPSISEPGPAAALVDRDQFLKMLDREGLAALWVIAGEKGVYGGRDSGRGFGGRYAHTTLYWYDGAWHNSQTHTERDRPSDRQLAELLGEEVV